MINPSHATTIIGETVQFECQSKTDVHWSHNGMELQTYVPSKPKLHSSKILTLSNINISNAGNYTCLGEDTNTKVEDTAVLTVIGK